jgi:hypothetical protein
MNDCFFCCVVRNLLSVVLAYVKDLLAGAASVLGPYFVWRWLTEYTATGHGRGGFITLLVTLIGGGVGFRHMWWSYTYAGPTSSLWDYVFRTCMRKGQFAQLRNVTRRKS